MRQRLLFALAGAVLFTACSHDGRVLDEPTVPLPVPATTTTLPPTALVELTIPPVDTAG